MRIVATTEINHVIRRIGCMYGLAWRPQKRTDATWQTRRALKRWEQLEYLAAVRCLMAKPGITPNADAPAAVSRYDDLVATHIIQAPSIHYVVRRIPTILFLPWIELTLFRAISCPGIGGSLFSMSRACATSAATRAPSRTGTGRWM